jgi:hypothetical protein
MAKIDIERSELFPFFHSADPSDDFRLGRKYAIELTDEEITDLRRVEAEFHAWQDRLEELCYGPDGAS